jgi:hypothetical protein
MHNTIESLSAMVVTGTHPHGMNEGGMGVSSKAIEWI